MEQKIDLLSEVENIVFQHWDTRGAPILLSKVGEELSQGAQAELRLHNGGLKRYVQTHMADRLRYLAMPSNGGGLAPVAVTGGMTDADLERLFAEKRRTFREGRRPSYYPPVWRAFRDPVPNGKRRFLEFGDATERAFHDIDAETEPAPGWLEIECSDLPAIGEKGVPSGDDISAAIQAWAEGKVALDDLILPKPVKQPHDRSAGEYDSSEKKSYPGSLYSLVAGLRGFTRDELSRISIPADVVLSFLERSSRGR